MFKIWYSACQVSFFTFLEYFLLLVSVFCGRGQWMSASSMNSRTSPNDHAVTLLPTHRQRLIFFAPVSLIRFCWILIFSWSVNKLLFFYLCPDYSAVIRFLKDVTHWKWQYLLTCVFEVLVIIADKMTTYWKNDERSRLYRYREKSWTLRLFTVSVYLDKEIVRSNAPDCNWNCDL